MSKCLFLRISAWAIMYFGWIMVLVSLVSAIVFLREREFICIFAPIIVLLGLIVHGIAYILLELRERKTLARESVEMMRTISQDLHSMKTLQTKDHMEHLAEKILK